MSKKVVRKLCMMLAGILLAAVIAPAAAFAAVSFNFYFDPGAGKLSGTIYLTDPQNVKVYAKKSGTVTDITYAMQMSEYKQFDQNNTVIHAVYFRYYGLDGAPDVITVDDGGRVFNSSNDTRGSYVYYMGGETISRGPYRMPGSHSYNNVTAATYLPANANLVSFTPKVVPIDDGYQDVPITGIEISLPQKIGDSSYFNKNNTVRDDFVLRDVTVQQNVYVEEINFPKTYKLVDGRMGFYDEEKPYRLHIKPRDPLSFDHEYSLSLSSTAGNEIITPAAGTGYYASVLIGDYNTIDSQNDGKLSFVGRYNFKSFIGITIGASASNTTESSGTGGTSAPGGISGNNAGTPGGIVEPVKPEGKGSGVVLSDDARVVTTDTAADGKKVTKVTFNEAKLTEAFDKLKDKATDSKVLVLEVSPTEKTLKVELPVSSLAEAAAKAPEAVLSIKTPQTSYDLPVKLLDVKSLAASLGVDAANVKIEVNIDQIPAETSGKYTEQSKKLGVKVLSDIIDFSITAEAGGKQIAVTEFGNTYVNRTISVNQSVYSVEGTAVMFDGATGKAVFVPSLFETIGGKTIVTIKRNGNSAYAVVTSSKSFGDMKKHWAKTDVELLASKLVVDGVEADKFAPDQSVTRAQFAVLVSKALGLNEAAASAQFTDIKASDWYAGYVGAAVKAGIVKGFEDGTFRPSELISREQMAVILAKAYEFAGKDVDLKGNKNSYLTPFADSVQIADWAQESAAKVTAAGLMNGNQASQFSPKANATRAEAVVVLKRMLQGAGFIN